ncbi:MAG: two-component system response regulator [Deltaproteobacteria bacterium RIFCSPHIGHO2_12_FULL_43_9]|nr:MAG: two-component system response regulator [Deltaproteobacteria bacterium RIFCSPHIGHO2_12_FULL_43_9]
MLQVLIVDDDKDLRTTLKAALSANTSFVIDEAENGEEAVRRVKSKNHDLVLLDVDMPILNGKEALVKIKEHNPATIVIMLTAYATLDDAVETIKHGAYNYLSKPIKSVEVVDIIKKAFEAHALVETIAFSSPIITLENGQQFIGHSREMKKVFGIINRLAKVDTAVLVRGESGTGKELVAKAIHFNGHRKSGRFVAVNSSAFSENLVESELFGHEKGAFTGADSRKIGKFQYAEGGTIFLDEIGDISPAMQVKLLRVLQEKRFTPVGSNREIEVDVRIIAATNRNLEEMIEQGAFREDLYYRLNVLPIFLPPLRERREEIEPLVHHFIKKFNNNQNRKITGIAKDALNILLRYNWQGNIRELENVIEHAFVLEASDQLTVHALPDHLLGLESEERGYPDNLLDFKANKEEFEKQFIINALKTFKGKINQTAEHANIPKKTLLRKIEKYGIKAEDYRN